MLNNNLTILSNSIESQFDTKNPQRSHTHAVQYDHVGWQHIMLLLLVVFVVVYPIAAVRPAKDPRPLSRSRFLQSSLHSSFRPKQVDVLVAVLPARSFTVSWSLGLGPFDNFPKASKICAKIWAKICRKAPFTKKNCEDFWISTSIEQKTRNHCPFDFF